MRRPADRICQVCGRAFQWRRKWARDWHRVQHCSKACRRTGLSDVDRRLERAIVQLLTQRARVATICPSEAARSVAGDEEWQTLMEPARRAARRLIAAGRLQMTQRGRVVEPSTARGPVRLKLRS